MDWWAITPYVDNLILTFHFWQNPNLIKFIKDTFANKEKGFYITAPVRPGHVYEDVERIMSLEDELGILIKKTQLYFNADPTAGMLEYSKEINIGEALVNLETNDDFINLTDNDILIRAKYSTNPNIQLILNNINKHNLYPIIYSSTLDIKENISNFLDNLINDKDEIIKNNKDFKQKDDAFKEENSKEIAKINANVKLKIDQLQSKIIY